jgi:hypothetical protein
MGRDECILWPNKRKDAAHPNWQDFHGTIRLSGGVGHYFHCALWCHKDGFQVFFTPWNKVFLRTKVEPSANQSVVKVKLLPPRSGEPPFCGETRRANVELRPAICRGLKVYWLKLSAKQETAE